MTPSAPAAQARDGSNATAGGPPRDRSVPALVAAALLVVLVGAGVLAFGVERPPQLPSVREEPEPAAPAEVAWTSWRDRTCVHVGELDGRTRQVWCGRSGADLVGWGEAEELRVLDWAEPEVRMLVLDADSGEVVRSEPAPAWVHGTVDDDLGGEGAPDVEPEPAEVPPWDRDPAVRAFRSGGELIVEHPDGDELWRVASPDSYTLRASSASPDGEWVAAIDSADRLLLIPSSGGDVRVWATDADTDVAPAWAPGGRR